MGSLAGYRQIGGRQRASRPSARGDLGRDRQVSARMRQLPYDPNSWSCWLGAASATDPGACFALSISRCELNELDRDLGLRSDLVWVISEADDPANQLESIKRCARCGVTKPISEFHNSRTRQLSYCAPCRREYDRSYYKLRGRVVRSARIQARRVAGREWLDSLKSGVPCKDCGEVFPEFVMHWDHLPGHDKVAAVSRLAREKSRELVLAELAKCELVCANCHAIRTSERRLTHRN